MKKDVLHPGAYVRAHVIPGDMNVTRAAKLLEVSRPTISNFLNGNADLSPEMAARLEAAFGASARELLDRQSAWDAAHTKRATGAPIIGAYVPPFLQSKAARIEEWAASGTAPRQRLSVLLRTLVNSTGAQLSKVDFPGNDDAERAGWDGEVVAGQATSKIPAGHSGWEFGVNVNIKGKADGDFAKSVIGNDAKQRKSMTFVFVTPRRWESKAKWVKEQKAKKLWKDVRAYDASDLEQWLEQSLPGQTWFANETGQDARGTISLDEAWKNWSADCEPSLSPMLFADAVRAAEPTLRRGLTENPSRPLIITADSKDEALAFLSAAFAAESEAFGTYRDRIIVFREPGSLSKLASRVSNFIPVIASRDVEKEFAPFKSSMPSFILYPRNALADEADIILETLNWRSFDTALQAMDLDRDRIDRLARESGRSPTVLRRRLSTLPAISTPDWASDSNLARSLIPYLFGGVWKADNKTDRATLELLAGDVPFDELERRLSALLPLDSSPVWSVGSLRGVVSKIDVLFAIRDAITVADLERFFGVAEVVLSEDDPSLELPEEDRWAASIYGKTREISGALRNGLGETLVLLAVYGPGLFKTRLNFDTEARTNSLVRSLLSPLTAKTLESQIDNVGVYAEAAPETFLSIIEADIKSPDSASTALMRPMSDAMFGSTPRTGLLWALEGMAWSNALFMRTVLVLGQLAERPLNDNLVNKPSNSLAAIFRAWMPQTSANLNAREAALKKLAEKHANTAWQICLDQFSPHSRFGSPSHKPRWRPDGHGLGDPLDGAEPNEFALFAFEMALAWPSHTRDMVCDLLDHLEGVHETLQGRIWDIVDKWAETADDEDRSIVRERIRVTTMTRKGRIKRERRSSTQSHARAKATFERLEPADPVQKHAWLYRKSWVDESVDEIMDDGFDYRARDERIAQQREDAVREVFAAFGIPGLVRLAECGDAGDHVGWSFAVVTADDAALVDAVVELVEGGAVEGARMSVVMGILSQSTERDLLAKSADRVSPKNLVSLLTSALFCRATWNVVETLGADVTDQYWLDVLPNFNRAPDEVTFAIERLLRAERPRAAFWLSHWAMKNLQPRVIFNLLAAVSQGSNEPVGSYLLNPHHLLSAFKFLNNSGDINAEEMAALEFRFIDIFDHDRGRPENLERAIAKNPELFVQAIGFAFKRSDDNEDPPELLLNDDERREDRARAGWKVLDTIKLIPGEKDDGTTDTGALVTWIEHVRAGSALIGRTEVSDQMIGQLLSHAPQDADGVWPSIAVRDALEQTMTDQIEIGLRIALFNSRGAHFRGEGGNQEREIAARHAGWADAMEYSHPRVAAMHRSMERSYLQDAEREDTDAKANRRLIR
ncbi:HigA family addiction module antitoxin [Jiella pacifica]|uniref:HigA family addiction module antidote protein n=1 Tax=Jiella pacifica TaxID=2696469 RepID=A0A6N9T7F0_9HYPH|nr:HigA family addiction module antitoxin [Jiella pacifica]NDW07303.1 HigA family addiction module antidote protein [Jiella pacifica]